MHIEHDNSPPLGELSPIDDESLRTELGVDKFVIAQSRVHMLGGRTLALDDVLRSGFPGRIGLVQNGDRLVIAIGCRDSHGSTAASACESTAKSLGGESGYQRSFGGALFTADRETGKVEIYGTSGDLGSIQSDPLKEFAASKLGDFIRTKVLKI